MISVVNISFFVGFLSVEMLSISSATVNNVSLPLSTIFCIIFSNRASKSSFLAADVVSMLVVFGISTLSLFVDSVLLGVSFLLVCASAVLVAVDLLICSVVLLLTVGFS